MSSSNSSVAVILLILMAGLGLINVFFPYLAWRWSEGWKFKERMEPSGQWILGARISGVIITVLCLFLALKACDQGREPSFSRELRLQVQGKTTGQNQRIHKNPLPDHVVQPAP